MYEQMERGKRLKIGMHALSSQDGEKVATIYGVDNQTVAQCRQEAKAMHDKMVDRYGPGYFRQWNLGNVPDNAILNFGIGPSMSEYEAAERRKREQTRR